SSSPHCSGYRFALVWSSAGRHAVSGRRSLLQAGGRAGSPVHIELVPLLSACLSASIWARGRLALCVGALGTQERPRRARVSVPALASGPGVFLPHPESELALYASPPAGGSAGGDRGRAKRRPSMAACGSTIVPRRRCAAGQHGRLRLAASS